MHLPTKCAPTALVQSVYLSGRLLQMNLVILIPHIIQLGWKVQLSIVVVVLIRGTFHLLPVTTLLDLGIFPPK